MAIPSINLNVRANTARAMADFKKFSDSLNNKFLVSGLKVDLISATLRQISSELQKSIGEQGLLGASSMRAAQNQAALLTSTFKGFGLEASKSINENMSKALSNVAVRAGGTMADIKKTMAAVPFISTNLTPEQRTSMAKQIMGFQRDLRRAGISDEFGALGTQFLSNRMTVGQMLESTDSLVVTIGERLRQKGAPMGSIQNAEQRTKLLQDVLNDPELTKFLQNQAKKTFGFRTYLEGLNTYLFNPESGVFGSLRKVKMSAYRTTTIFDETDKLIKSIFGPEGIFLKFFKSIGRVFGVGDPLKIVIMGMDFIRNQIGNLAKIIASPQFQQIITYAKVVFDSTLNLFKRLYDQVTNYNWAGFFTKGENLFQRAPQQEGGKNQFEQIWESISKSAKKFDASRYINRPYKPEDLAQGNFEFGDLFNGQIFNSKTITEDIKKIGEAFRDAVENFSKKIRGIKPDDEVEFGSSIMGVLVEEIGRSIVTVIKETFAVLVNKAPQIAKEAIPALNEAFKGILQEMFGGLAGVARTVGMFLPGPLGMIARASVATDALGKGGIGASANLPLIGETPLGLLGLGAAAFFPRIRSGILGAGRNRVIEAQKINKFRFWGREGYAARRAFWARDGRWDGDGPGGSGGGGRRGPTPAPPGKVTTTLYDYDADGRAINPQYGSRSWLRNGPPNETRQELQARRREFLTRERLSEAEIRRNPRSPLFRYSFNPETRGIDVVGRSRFDASAGRSMGYGFDANVLTREGRRYAKLDRRFADYTSYRARFGRTRLGRGLGATGRFFNSRLGKGAAILGVAGIIGSMISGGRGNAAELDPETVAMLEAAQAGDPYAMEMLKSRGYSDSKISQLNKQRQAQAQRENQGNAMGGVLSGAANGAMMGMMFGPWGAAIGGLLGAGAALMDKGTREGVMGFIGNLGKGLANLWKRVTNSLGKMGERVKNGAISAGNFLAEGLKKAFTGVINALMEVITFIPRMQTNLVKSIINLFPENMRPGWLVNSVNMVDKVLGFRFGAAENNYRGKDYYGPAMAHEERMSGGRARIYNDREFVIPPDGFNILAGLLEHRVRGPRTPVTTGDRIELVINVNNPVMLGNNRELIESLRKPVIDIVNDAYRKNVGVRSRPQYVV